MVSSVASVMEFRNLKSAYSIAFSHLLHKDIAIYEAFLSVYFRPNNFYCIHIDKESKDKVWKAVQGLVKCYSEKMIHGKIFLIDKKDSLKVLKQVIDLDINDSYVSFGVQDKNTGLVASVKSSALIITEETRKKLEQEAPGDKVHQIKPKLGKKALKKKKELERNKTKGNKSLVQYVQYFTYFPFPYFYYQYSINICMYSKMIVECMY